MDHLVEILKKSGVVIMPTDTIYGIIGDATNDKVIKRVFDIKKRDSSKAMLMLVSDINMLNDYVSNIGYIERKLIDSFWPGPLTIIFKKKNVSDLLTGGLDTVGIRCPADKDLITLIQKLGKPILSTSVNVSGFNQVTSVDLIDKSIINKVDSVIDKGICNGVASTILSVDDGKIKILREGEIKEKDIYNILGN